MWNLRPWVALCTVLAVACDNGGTDQHAVAFEIEGVEDVIDLRVRAKYYADDDRVTLYESESVLVQTAETPFRLLVELPVAGRWAVHFVGLGLVGAPRSDTRCVVVDGAVTDRGAFLLPLEDDLDEDGDSFIDDFDLWCAARAEAGLDCESPCHEREWRALVDCDPPPDYEVGPGCPDEIPADAEWNPFTEDWCGDCFNQDCYQGDAPCLDEDGDGSPNDVDCDDANPDVHPGAEEGCRRGDTLTCPGCDDGVDTNCDGRVDEGCFAPDLDGDGVTADEDCNDCSAAVAPGREEICGNDIDEDCSSPDDLREGDLTCPPNDDDGDGELHVPMGDDCDDDDPDIYPGAPDYCGDGVAQGCDEDVDCSAIEDFDFDHFGADVDCDDEDENTNPWAVEVCDQDGADEDCDGLVNEGPGGWNRGCVRDETGIWRDVDLRSDEDHCGACRHRCSGSTWSEGDRCEGGECRCAGRAGCDGDVRDWCCPGQGGCRDLSSDPESCGACGRACNDGEVCESPAPGERGECRCPWSPGRQPCLDDPCFRCCEGVGCVDVCENPGGCVR